jgi:hypothetical protein
MMKGEKKFENNKISYFTNYNFSGLLQKDYCYNHVVELRLHWLAQAPSHCLTVQAAGASQTVQGIIILSFATTAWSKIPFSTGIASSHAQPLSRFVVWSWIRN